MPEPTPRIRQRPRIDPFSPEVLIVMGEVTDLVMPDKWNGWPNGSACFKADGKRYCGRTIFEKLGRIHVLRWNPIKKTHVYDRVVASDLQAFAIL